MQRRGFPADPCVPLGQCVLPTVWRNMVAKAMEAHKAGVLEPGEGMAA